MTDPRHTARGILTYGDDRLRAVCRAVGPDEDVDDLAADLVRTLHEGRGVGLAAPQIGDRRRVIVCRPPADGTLVMINPVIETHGGGSVPFEEGCLSFAGLFLTVHRPRMIRVRYRDRGGCDRVLEDAGLLARIVQHEVDHLDGILFIDRVPCWRRWLAVWPRRRRWRRTRERAA